MINIDNISVEKKYIHIRVERPESSKINNWDRLCLDFLGADKKITNAYYINGLKKSNEILVRNIPIPKMASSLKILPIGEFNVTAILFDKVRYYTNFEQKLFADQLHSFNGQYYFQYPSKVPPKKIIITLPGMGNNIDHETQYSIMTMRTFPFGDDVFRIHLMDLFWANGSCLLFNEDKEDNINNIIALIDGLLNKYGLTVSDCHIITASKGCFAGFEIMKRRSYRFAFFAPITNVDRFNESSPVMRFISREVLNNGYRFFKPKFNDHVVVYTSHKDPGIDLELLSNCCSVVDPNLMHAQITKRFISEYLSSEKLIADNISP